MIKTINGGKMPTRASKYSAGVDVYANEDVVIAVGETKTIGLGICIDHDQIKETIKKKIFDIDLYTDEEIDELYYKPFLASHYIQMSLRSSLGVKGLILPNCVGIIDLDYKDEMKMIIHNPESGSIEVNKTGFDDWGTFYINKGDKIGQLILLEHKGYLFGIESENERTGGFGSSGK